MVSLCAISGYWPPRYTSLNYFGLKAVQMLQMASFGHHFGPQAEMVLQTVSFNVILYNFGPKAAQMLQMRSFGSTLKHFGPKAAQMLKIVSFAIILNHLLSDGFL